MFKRALTLIMIVAGVGAAGLLGTGPVDATEHSATRSFSSATVTAGDTLDVTIEIDGIGPFGAVTETIPDGFTFVSTTLESGPGMDGQILAFGILGEDSFTYTVMAPAEVGDYTFHGIVSDSNRDDREVGGDADVTVEPRGLNASRSFSAETVGAGGQLTVTIMANNYGSFGQVVETLPAGFAYSSSTLEGGPAIDGRMLSFNLLGEESFSYTVIASATLGAHTFSGVVKDEILDQAEIGGDSSVAVTEADVPHSAIRSADSRVEAGADVVVSIDLAGLGGFGQVMESLPDGFAYVSSSLPDGQVESMDGAVTFTILDEDSFSYTVTASDADGDNAVAGMVYNDAKLSTTVTGDSMIAVGDATVTSDAGNVTLTITPAAQSTYFMATITEACEAGPEEAAEVAFCATVSATGADGETIDGFSLDAPSTLVMDLSAEQVEELGGGELIAELQMYGGIVVQTRAGADATWSTLAVSTVVDEETGAAGMTVFLTEFGEIVVTLDRAKLPVTGGTTVPTWLILALATAGALMIPAGLLAYRRTRA